MRKAKKLEAENKRLRAELRATKREVRGLNGDMSVMTVRVSDEMRGKMMEEGRVYRRNNLSIDTMPNYYQQGWIDCWQIGWLQEDSAIRESPDAMILSDEEPSA